MNAKRDMRDLRNNEVPHEASMNDHSHTQQMRESNMERGSPDRKEGRSDMDRDANIRGSHTALR